MATVMRTTSAYRLLRSSGHQRLLASLREPQRRLVASDAPLQRCAAAAAGASLRDTRQLAQSHERPQASQIAGFLSAAAVVGLGAGLAVCEAPAARGADAGDDYPAELGGGERLVAAGMRLMTPLKVPVYALGLYCDAAYAGALLSQWAGVSGAGILDDREFWERLSSPSSALRRTVRMVTVREVSGDHMQTGFNRGLAWRVKAMSKRTRLAGGKEALKKFNRAFKDAGVMKEGTEILVRFLGQGWMQVCIEGRPPVDIDSPVLVWAVLQMFYGEKSVAPNVKERVAHGFAEILSVA